MGPLLLGLLAACEKPVAKKPLIYLYPPEPTEVTVRFADPEGVDLTASYPDYGDGWVVDAEPDGTLTDADGRSYYGLYWEGEVAGPGPLSEGFVVASGKVEPFLESALADLGLTEREAQEFIVYWAPILEAHPHVFVHFATDAWDAQVPLDVAPAPDTVVRVLMYWRPCRGSLSVRPQRLSGPDRADDAVLPGFTLVEWGGARLR